MIIPRIPSLYSHTKNDINRSEGLFLLKMTINTRPAYMFLYPSGALDSNFFRSEGYLNLMMKYIANPDMIIEKKTNQKMISKFSYIIFMPPESALFNIFYETSHKKEQNL